MPSDDRAAEPIRVRVSSRSSMVDVLQEITLQTALNRALDLVWNSFHHFHREAEVGSVFSLHERACETDYAALGDHKTTLTYTTNFARSFLNSGVEYLKAATNAALNTGPDARWSSLALTRSLIEASAACYWLVEPGLDLDTRLRRTNQMLVRGCHEILNVLPDDQGSYRRFMTVDPAVRETCLEVRDTALQWAIAQGWKCQNGKSINRSRWISEIPGHKEAVVLAGQGEPVYWKDVYSVLSGATHSQPFLMAFSISEEPEVLLKRALTVLDIGLSVYMKTLHAYSSLMGWDDHELDSWFEPVHSTLQHIIGPDETPLPAAKFEPEMCAMCPDYESPFMHRLALVSHVASLLERNVQGKHPEAREAPERYALATELLNRLDGMLVDGDGPGSGGEDLRNHAGTGHTSALSLLGFEPSELLTSIAASWAVLRAPSYQENLGTVQGWMFRPDDQTPPIPHGNR